MDEYEVKEVSIVGTELVAQGNKLIDSPRMLTLQEQKLFLLLVSKLNPEKREDTVFRISADDFANVIGVDSQNDIYRDMRKIAKSFSSRVISIRKHENDGDKSIMYIPFVSYAKYWIGKGCLDIKISDSIAPYLFELRRDFTTYKLSQVTTISSIHAVRIYEMLKKQANFGSRTFFIDDLKQKLLIKESQYKRFSNFKNDVLEISKREINEKTDILIDYKLIKTGRKFTAVQFNIKPKNEKKTKKQSKFLESYNSAPDSKYVYELMEFGFKGNSANRMLCRLQNSDIENAISAVKERIQKGKCKNPKAMLQTALKERWTPSSSATETRKSHPKSEIVIEDVPVEEILETEKTDANVCKKKSFGFFSFLNKMLSK